jgi:signal transduction histidine kinase
MRTAGHYALALVLVAFAFVATAFLAELLAPMRLLFLWAAVLIAAVVGGTGPGLAATGLAIVGAGYLVFSPFHSMQIASPVDLLRLTMFGVFAGGLSIAVGSRRHAQQRARASEERSAFINRASDLLSASLASQETLRNLARLCVPALGDWCAIDLGHGPGYRRDIVEHTDPSRLQLLLRLDREFRPRPEDDPIVNVMQTGRTHFLDNLTDEKLAALTGSEERLRLARTLGLRSWIIAPMVARGRTLGTLTVVHGDSGRRFVREDVPLVEELARRAATALDNARLYETAEHANRAKDEFLATLSHELRTPLTAISGWAHMLTLGIPDEETRTLAVQTIVRSARAQGELIDDLLDLSGVVAGTVQLEITPVNLAELVAQVVDAVRPAADAKEISVELSAPHPVVVRGDARRLRQVIWNLLTNAVKFTSARGSVRARVEGSDTTATIEVADNGRGVEPWFLPYVWDRFRQADSSTSRHYGGLGLGLAVVRHFAELHGGTVHVTSDGLNRGATFRVEIPLAPPSTRDAIVAASAEPVSLHGRRILLVDDDPDARVVLSKMLMQFGADVATAGDVGEATRLLEQGEFDAVVSDIAMPGEDGFVLAGRTRTPMVAVSAMSTGDDDRRRALEAGFLEFVRKPVDPGELARAVAGVLRP